MHFDAARALIAFALTTAMFAAIQDRGPHTHPGAAGIRRTLGAMACLIV